ncbi:PREDICTED: IQ domain-containing protein H-like [Polistes dominula]|uniref:IQ domain-containing protein H-like n=1 Tax=Polistes dominula TaxID=743375 RepID=A0ABM1IM99_POLDO|nr:PREDICTED: IQ domain-containing protein H-like [Polistes dominula]
MCADDSVILKNSYYCVATLCPCMTKNYGFNGPLILGPFNFGPQTEQINVCQNKLDQSKSSVCSSLDSIDSFHYSDCIADSDTNDCNDSINSSSSSSQNVICPKLVECTETKPSRKVTKCRKETPIILEHHCSYVSFPDRRAEEHLEKSYSKKSEEVAKWGKCYDVVDSVFYERDKRIKICEQMGLNIKVAEQDSKKVSCKCENADEEELLSTRVCGLDKRCTSKLRNCKRKETEDDVSKHICSRPSHTCRVGFDGACITGDDFDNLDRFRDIGSCGFAKLCRKLFKWVHCISKNWHDLRSYPHIVVHLPSLNYNNELKCRARKTFDYLQNIQVIDLSSKFYCSVGRVGWLDDPNVEVLYIFPTPQSEELLTILQDLIISVRPDVDISKRLLMLRPEPKCLMKKCVSGSANLFFSPDVYRRVRFLTAGRHAFILSGVIDQKNIFIACELKIPIMGPPLQFQKRLSSKSYIMELLDVNKIQHPPFLHVHSFGQLCRGMAVMIIQYPMYKTWFVKIDNGFYGYQTAIVRFKTGILGSAIRNIERTGNIKEDFLCKLLAETLPTEMQVQKSIYPNNKEFFHDLESFGKFHHNCGNGFENLAIFQACPNNYYDVLSIGVFIEHDLAKPVVITAAEIIHFGRDIRNDMAYFLPQNKILRSELEQLVDNVGTILRNEHVVGYFGIDLVSFRDQFDVGIHAHTQTSFKKKKNQNNYKHFEFCIIIFSKVQQFWVIDIDPYYTDLIAFSDWVKFCVGPCKDGNEKYAQQSKNESKISNITELLIKVNRHAICCGKLYGTGLSKYCGQTLINLCKQNQIYYDNQEKIGCMIYPTDSHNRALNIVSINSTRLLTIKKFIEALKILNQLSLRNNIHETLVDTVDLCNHFKLIE